MLICNQKARKIIHSVCVSYLCSSVCPLIIRMSLRACSLPTPGMPSWKKANVQLTSCKSLISVILMHKFQIKALSLLSEYNHSPGKWPDRQDSLWTDVTLFVPWRSCNSPPEGPGGEREEQYDIFFDLMELSISSDMNAVYVYVHGSSDDVTVCLC